MKNIIKTFIFVAFATLTFQGGIAHAQFVDQNFYQTSPDSFNSGFNAERSYIQQLIAFYLSGGQIGQQPSYSYTPSYTYDQNSYSYGYGYNAPTYSYTNGTPGYTYTPSYGTTSSNSSNNDERPDVDTDSARDVEDDSAELRGDVDMNDFNNGIVFFVYGQDEDMIEDVEDDYDEYDDVRDDEESDDFEVVRVDRDLDSDDSYDEEVTGLEEDEDYYFIICVEYEDEDNDQRLECGDVEDFETDGDNNSDDDEPEVETDEADDIDDDSAELRGSVDMNDYDDGRVFFVWGEDEDDVEDVENEDRYSDIDEDGDDLRKETVEINFNGNDNFELDVFQLDDDTDHYFRICVEYEDDDNDDTLECGDVEEFETDN